MHKLVRYSPYLGASFARWGRSPGLLIPGAAPPAAMVSPLPAVVFVATLYPPNTSAGQDRP